MAPVQLNIWTAWFASLAGVLTGAVQGLFFPDDHWLGGYASWPRRMLRLGHIAWFGVGLLNLAFAVTVNRLHWVEARHVLVPAVALAAAALLMPSVCYLAAWRKSLRHLFVLPVGCVLLGVGGLLLAKGLYP
jgi:hypothetical protein